VIVGNRRWFEHGHNQPARPSFIREPKIPKLDLLQIEYWDRSPEDKEGNWTIWKVSICVAGEKEEQTHHAKSIFCKPRWRVYMFNASPTCFPTRLRLAYRIIQFGLVLFWRISRWKYLWKHGFMKTSPK